MALFSSFKLSKRISAFEQLADGKALMEVRPVIHWVQLSS